MQTIDIDLRPENAILGFLWVGAIAFAGLNRRRLERGAVVEERTGRDESGRGRTLFVQRNAPSYGSLSTPHDVQRPPDRVRAEWTVVQTKRSG